jgi:hypothetical protein
MTVRDTATTAAKQAVKQLARRHATKTAATTTATSAAGPWIAAALAAVAGVVAVVLVVVFIAVSAVANRSPAAAGNSGSVDLRGLRGLVACAAAATTAGFTGTHRVEAVAVAHAESKCDPAARNPNGPTRGCPSGSLDRGGWQINDCYHPEVTTACADDLACAAREAFRISAAGSTWTPWSTWNNGSAAAAMSLARAAVAALTFTGPQNDSYQRLTPNTKDLYQQVVTRFGVTDIGGWRPVGSVESSDHPKGRAIDAMVGTTATGFDLGSRIANWTVANAKQLQVKYVIFHGRIWTPQAGWHGYRHPSDPCNCNPTLRHDDHVHISTLV